MDKYLKVTMVILLVLTVGVAIFPSSALSDGDTVTEPLLEDTFTIGVANDDALRSLSAASKVKGPRDKQAVRYFNDDKKCLAESYSITLNNGVSQKQDRVTSAVVILNDKILYKQSDFNRRFTGDSKTLPIDLITGEGNVLEVKVNGKPGANIAVGIYGHYSDSGSGGNNVPGALYLDMDGDLYGSEICMPGDVCFDWQAYGVDYVWVNQGGDCDETDPQINPSIQGSCPVCI